MSFSNTLVLATHNRGKLSDFLEYFEGFPMEIVPLSMYTNNVPEETGETFEDNALIKVRAAFLASGKPSLSDDAGICVTALDGKPGVHTAEFATDELGNRNYPMAFEKFKNALKDKDHSASFVSVLAYKDAETEKIFKGEVHGRLDFKDMANIDGFGYTPIFIPHGATQTFAQMDIKTRAEHSHRGRAVRLFQSWFLEKFKIIEIQ